MSNLHRDVDDSSNHNAKNFNAGVIGSYLIKSEGGVQYFEKMPVFTAALNFVDGHDAPPTNVAGDIYVLIDLGNGAVHNDWLNALGAGTDYNSWVRKSGGAAGLWLPIQPVEGNVCFNKNDGYIYYFDGSSWAAYDPPLKSTDITGLTAVTALGSDYGILSDSSDGGALKKFLLSDIQGATEVGSGTNSLQQIATSNDASGDNSVAMGNSSTAAGLGAVSIGWACQSNATRTFTTGFVCIANNIGAFAGGEGVTTSGNYGFGYGQSITIGGINGVALGVGHSNLANYAGALSGDNTTITATSQRSVVCGGSLNYIDGIYSVIGGGGGNQINANYCSIPGGQNNNTSTFANTHIIGSNITADKANYTFVENLNVKSGGFLIETTGSSQVLKTTNSSEIGFYTATPIVQPTTSVTAASFTANTSGIVDDTATFDGYTIGQVVAALRNLGILA